MTERIHRRAKVIGSAGCGKTRHLMRLVRRAVERFGSEGVAAVSYTKTAVEEIRARVVAQLHLDKDSMRNMRTIHSHCYHLLGLRTDQVADEMKAQWNIDNPDLQLPTRHMDPEEGWESDWNRNENYRLHETMNVLRNHMVPEERWPVDVQRFHRRWDMWMFQNDLVDFTGMLERVLEHGHMLDVAVLLVDEAQDVTPLSMAVMEKWSENTENTTLVGDSLQAIFRFAGSVPETFINYTYDHLNVLERSYRVPRRAHAYAMRIAGQVTNREREIAYAPTDVEGAVIETVEPDLSLEGQHMILVRCNKHVKRWKDFLMRSSTPWCNPYRPDDKDWNPTETRLWDAARTYVRIKAGGDVTFKDLRAMVREMRARGNLARGAQANIDEAIEEMGGNLNGERVDLFTLIGSGIFTEELLSFRKPIPEIFRLRGQNGDLLRLTREEDVSKRPRVQIGTVHSFKGAECDHAWFDTRGAGKSEKAIRQGWRDGDPTAFDDECRIAYVACTRSRQTLGLLRSGNERVNMVLPEV